MNKKATSSMLLGTSYNLEDGMRSYKTSVHVQTALRYTPECSNNETYHCDYNQKTKLALQKQQLPWRRTV
jgi:hypothetical protein